MVYLSTQSVPVRFNLQAVPGVLLTLTPCLLTAMATCSSAHLPSPILPDRSPLQGPRLVGLPSLLRLALEAGPSGPSAGNVEAQTDPRPGPSVRWRNISTMSGFAPSGRFSAAPAVSTCGT